jgi:hypothetical protein
MRVVHISRAVQADLKGQVLAGHRAEGVQPRPPEEHPVGEDRRGQRLGAQASDLTDVRQQERLAAGEVELVYA